MIEAIHVHKSFEGKDVLQDVNLRLEGTVAIMAPSGAGKTTLLRILMGLIPPDAGEIRKSGDRIGAVFQEDRLIEHMTAVQNLALVCKKSRVELKQHLAWLGLENEADARVSTFSGGMKRRVAIARAVVCEPDILLLDEPFTGLDEDMRAAAADYIRKNSGAADIVVITHDRDEADLLGAQNIFAL